MQLQHKFLSYLLPYLEFFVLESGVIYPVTYFTPVINVSSDLVKTFLCSPHNVENVLLCTIKSSLFSDYGSANAISGLSALNVMINSKVYLANLPHFFSSFCQKL